MTRKLITLLVCVLTISYAIAQRDVPMLQLQKLNQTLYAISNMYVDSVKVDNLVEDAIEGILTELDPNNEIQPRGMKTFVIPPHGLPTCSDVLVSCIQFILPDEGFGLSSERVVRAQFVANYIDNNYSCCSGFTTAS